MPLIFSRDSPRYKKFVRDRRRWKADAYKEIVQKHHLDITPAQMDKQALKSAVHEADRHFQVFTDFIKDPGKLFKFIGAVISAIAAAIAGALLSIATFGAGTPLAIAGTVLAAMSAISSIASTMAMNIVEANAQAANEYLANKEMSYKQAIELSHSAQSTAGQASTVRSLIYSPYAILPEGAIYKDENPGTIGYRGGLEAPNCMKGINNTKAPNELAEQINNTKHRYLAGNTQFDPLNLPFPTSKAALNAKITQECMQGRLKQAILDVQEGFKELAAKEFGAFDGQTFKKLYDHNVKKLVHPKVDALNTWVFLRQMKYYPNGQRIPLFKRINYPDKIKMPKGDGGDFLVSITAKRFWTEESYSGFGNTAGSNSQSSSTTSGQDVFTFESYEGTILDAQITSSAPEDVKGQKIILVRKQVKDLPKKSPKAWHYENIKDNEKELDKLDLKTLEDLEKAYNAWLVLSWESYQIEALGAANPEDLKEQAQALAKEQNRDFNEVFYCGDEDDPKTKIFNSYAKTHEIKEWETFA